MLITKSNDGTFNLQVSLSEMLTISRACNNGLSDPNAVHIATVIAHAVFRPHYKVGDRVGLLSDDYEPYNLPGTVVDGPLPLGGLPYVVKVDGEETTRTIPQSILAPWPHTFHSASNVNALL
jgi:hypothetical protein